MILTTNSFFFSSRRRHTRSDRDWSSDVCSSDLERVTALRRAFDAALKDPALIAEAEKSKIEIGRASCRKSVDLGGRRIIKKKKKKKKNVMHLRHNEEKTKDEEMNK